MRMLPPIDLLPRFFSRLVLKARSAEAAALDAASQARIAASSAREFSLLASRGESSLRVSPFGNGYTYSGQWGKNSPHGLGVLDASSKGGVFAGQFRHGYMQGFGIFDFDPDKPMKSLRYSGKYWRDLMHGCGTYEWASGSCWFGELKMDAIIGYGVFTWPDGRVFEGHRGGKPAHRHDVSQINDRVGVEWQLGNVQPKIGKWTNHVFEAAVL